jgi:hypothetical protein
LSIDGRKLVGVGGWLAFLILSLGVFGPIRVVVGLYGDLYRDPSIADFYGPRWPAAQAIEWTTGGLTAAASLYLAWRLYAIHTPATLRLVRIGLWGIAILPTLAGVLAQSALMGVAPTRLIAEIGLATFRPLIYAAIWTAYLFRSTRVANTYRDHVPDELRAVFE